MSRETSLRKGSRPVHVIFVGAGAVGSFYASRLHHPDHGISVSLVARSNYSVIAKKGVVLNTHSFGTYKFAPHSVFSTPKEAADAARRSGYDWDYVVIATKALPDRADDSDLIAPLIGQTTCITIIQNGVGVEAPYRNRFPGNAIVTAVTVISAEQIDAGVIRQNRWSRITIGPYSNGLGTGDATLCRSAMLAASQLSHWWGSLGGIRDVELEDEVGLQMVRWHKLCINAAMNPSAILSGGRGNADMVTDPELREHLTGVMDEIWDAVPRILGRPFPTRLASPEKIMRSTERNKGGKPSMLLDWEAGRPLELEVILGNPVRIAKEKGVALPRLQTLYALLKSAEELRAKKSIVRGGKL